jgi:hypothetical protein
VSRSPPPPTAFYLGASALANDDPDRGPESDEADGPARHEPGDPEDAAVAPAQAGREVTDARAAPVQRDDLERRRRSLPVRARRRGFVLGQRLEEAVERLLESPLLPAARQAS